MTAPASPFGATARLRRLIFLAAAVAAVLLALFALKDSSELDRGAAIYWPAMLAALLVTVLHFCLEPARWTYYTRSPERPVSTSTYWMNFKVYTTTALMSYSLPFKLGIPLRIYFLKRYLGLEAGRALQVIGIDGALGIAWWALLATPFLVFLVPGWLRQGWPLIAAGATATAVAVLVTRTARFQNLLERWRQLDWSVAIPSGRGLTLISLLLIVDILSYGFRHQFIALAVVDDVTLWIVFLAGVVATFAGIASALPMGLGAYDASLVALLAIAGVAPEDALLIAGLNRALNISTSIVLGGLSSWRLPIDSGELAAKVVAEKGN